MPEYVVAIVGKEVASVYAATGARAGELARVLAGGKDHNVRRVEVSARCPGCASSDRDCACWGFS